MTKNEIYQQLPSVLRRLFTWGLGGSVLFLAFWYYGGLNLWGSVIAWLLSFAPGLGEISFRAGGSNDAAILCDALIDGMYDVQITFPVNILNLTIIEVITLLAIFPADRREAMLKTGLLSFFFLPLYHVAHSWLQLYKMKIGPDVANQIGIFWDETTWFLVIHKLGSFDVFLVRYWGGIPIFILAFMVQHFLAFPRKATT
ncbi:hypothetical protein [Acanthopleuribacter pedis]|uniref:Uncharacterized protein n=1 Tax=Acanthopleuribacter pedis TaxID=442870 RepID=A0A8J7U4M2_9BACT|nr:hypothetical protein [Acanthopleuribacter pedis]MBO1319934.1 hypothetical protein [Acanthopleuribacter pedis]